jgi:signal transduction histidine kinase
MTISLKKLIKTKELFSLIHELVNQLHIAIEIQLLDGTKLVSFGDKTSDKRYPVEALGEIIGWVVGEEPANLVANLLSVLAKQEIEKKELAKELLERYQEIDLFEDISTQLTTSLNTRQIAQLVLQEMSQLIESSAGIILLLSADRNSFEMVAEFGIFFDQIQPQPDRGIIGYVVQSGRSQLINDVQADPRIETQKNVNSMICVPLRAKERIVGAIAIGTEKTDAYKAEHLKLVSIFASQTAIAIEKALLYEQSCQTATEAKAQAKKLQQALKDLQQAQTQLIQSEKMSSLGQLVAGVAHEINNPLNFICGNLRYVAEYATHLLNLLQEYQKFLPIAPPELQSELDNIDLEFIINDLPKLLDSMKLGTDRIVEIVQSLKTFSRHDEAQMKPVNIHDGIDGTLMILRHRLKSTINRQAIQISKDYAELPLIECYPGQLNQVFMNIISNAIDALEEKIEQEKQSNSNYIPQIEICSEIINNQWALIHIKDNGQGMKEEVMRRMYDPFFSTKEVGKGTGLGMAISHQIIVDRHRGILKCRSQPGEGTEFLIQIPLSFTEGVNSPESINIKSVSNTEHELPIINTKSSSTDDINGFISSTTPTLKPVDLLIRHIQLIRRLAHQQQGVTSASPEQIYQMFQHYPISLKLYTTLLSSFYCPNDIDESKGNS